MTVIIPICAKDVGAALRNLAWCEMLEGGRKFQAKCIISRERGFMAAGSAEEAARRVFSEVIGLMYDPYHGRDVWPRPQNYAFRVVATFMSRQPSRDFWFWWEQDAVPLKSGWLDQIMEAHKASGKAFLGAMGVVPNGKAQHIAGVAVYPWDAVRVAPGLISSSLIPFDVGGGQRALQQAQVTPLIQHVWSWAGPNGPAPKFEYDSDLSKIDPEAVLFHRCKDGSLVERLKARIAVSKEAEPTEPKVACSLPENCIPFTGHFDVSSGYGIYTTSVATELIRRCYPVELRSPSLNGELGQLPNEIRSRLTTTRLSASWEFIIYPCVVQPANLTLGTHEIAYLTMWESTRLVSKIDPARTQAINVMNRCKVIMVPNSWNITVFSANGVDTPMRLVPLGIDVDAFPLVENLVESKIFTFGTAARSEMGGVRKGFNLVVDAFLKAFPTEPNVRLRLKCFPHDPPIDAHGDPRINTIRSFLPLPKLVDWYKSLNVFVSGSGAEGWGRHQQEAMCMGRPVIGISWGGVAEFFNETNGYAVDWVLEPGQGIYETMGHYAKPNVDSMAKRMQEAYEDREELNTKVGRAAVSARRFTLIHSVDCILNVLREFGFMK